MNAFGGTDTQHRRLKELDVGQDLLSACFNSAQDRNRAFQTVEKKAVKQARDHLQHFLSNGLRPRLCNLKSQLVETLNRLGFAQVVTPTIMSRDQLGKMSIDDDHPLCRQIYWLNQGQCLRPMLAPNLYSLMFDLGRFAERPIRFFEIGTCFRKESEGARHCSEFTMLNLVEMGLAKEDRQERMLELGRKIVQVAGIADYTFEGEASEVYGNTLDILAGPRNIEIASGAMGPHVLDATWRVTDTWIGWGFGLERLVMAAEANDSLGKWGKSLAYLDGIRLSI